MTIRVNSSVFVLAVPAEYKACQVPGARCQAVDFERGARYSHGSTVTKPRQLRHEIICSRVPQYPKVEVVETRREL
jgi:hypothetical protein